MEWYRGSAEKLEKYIKYFEKLKVEKIFLSVPAVVAVLVLPISGYLKCVCPATCPPLCSWPAGCTFKWLRALVWTLNKLMQISAFCILNSAFLHSAADGLQLLLRSSGLAKVSAAEILRLKGITLLICQSFSFPFPTPPKGKTLTILKENLLLNFNW